MVHHRRHLSPLDPQILFAGQWLDNESGLAYNRFRYYDPETANYLTLDPIGLQGGETPYRYVANPLDWVDWLGLSTCPTLTKDALGRVTHAEVTVTRDMIGTGTGINKTARNYAQSIGQKGDDAGHILAKALGGQGGIGNVFPQLSSINRGAYREFEKSVRKKLDQYGSLDLKWKFEYSGAGKRPTKIIYDVYHKGNKVLYDVFKNI